MNYDQIISHLIERGYDAKPGEFNDSVCLQVDISIDDESYVLKHFHVEELTALPSFFLHDDNQKSGLAHILPLPNSGVAGICVTTEDSVSVNYEVPELAFEDSLIRHVGLLEKAISDSEWNCSELTREFAINWSLLCKSGDLDFVCASHSANFEILSVMTPMTGKESGLAGSYVGLSESSNELSEFSSIKRNMNDSTRKRTGRGVIVPLGNLSPPPPNKSEVTSWYLQTISDLDSTIKDQLKNATRFQERKFWVIFNGNTPSGLAWFGIQFESSDKKFLPLSEDTVKTWDIRPIRVKIFNPESMLPRGGASIPLKEKSVLLIGCGSVGGHIAHQLASSGIGRIDLTDPEKLTWDNIYRHVLTSYWVGYQKSTTLALELENKYPWIKASAHKKRLLDFRDEDKLKAYDLIIIAIGSPTHERIFYDFYQSKETLPPVINTWVEGYGVGGHATLQILGKKGCLLCAYVNNVDYSRGLSSNLNFIEKNQCLTVNAAGCGDLFLPYSGIDASQTAIIASGLAVRHLMGNVVEPCSVSWKGSDDLAKDNEIELTHRFYNFSNSLQELPLHHEGCDVCSE